MKTINDFPLRNVNKKLLLLNTISAQMYCALLKNTCAQWVAVTKNSS